jgi:hypothetical protein
MFMTPDEILGGSYVHGSVDQSGDDMRTLMTQKLGEAKESGVYDDIAAHGVRTPVILASQSSTPDYLVDEPREGAFVIGNGNRRTAAAAEVQRVTGRQQHIPVIHDNDYLGSPKTHRVFNLDEG